MVDEIDFDSEELSAAEHWHDGHSSMLYAISSTGSLKRGSRRPCWEDGSPMSDEEWMSDLAARLEIEASQAAEDAGKQAKKARGSEREELLNEQEALISIADKAERAQR